jgi:uncharacterized membrane protein YhaH (DUF805 family)
MNWYTVPWQKFATFTGRARRREFWIFGLGNLLIVIVLSMIDASAGLFSAQVGLGALSGLFALATLVPSLAVGVRRMHDTGRSGWWIILALIPLANLLVLVLALFDSQPGDNAYGPNPKGVQKAG